MFTACGTFTDEGFGFHNVETEATEYHIAWPLDGGAWAVLSSAYSLTDEDRDDYCDADFRADVLERNGYASLDDLSAGELTAVIAERQDETRFAVPSILADSDALARHFAALGVSIR